MYWTIFATPKELFNLWPRIGILSFVSVAKKIVQNPESLSKSLKTSSARNDTLGDTS